MTSSFLSEPYPKPIVESVRTNIELVDKSLLGLYVKMSMTKCADVLERQRGPAYGIGSFSSRSDPMFIGQQVPAGVSVNVIPSHNLGPEHIFGDGRQRLTQFGDRNFNVMREGLTIAHNEDLAFRNHNWKTAAFNKLVKKAREMTAKFEKEQRELKVDKITGVENLLEPGRKEARLLDLLKRKHDGPITFAEQVDELLKLPEYVKDQKKLKLALENEISFSKTLFKNIPAKSPLFIQRKNSVEQLANNLRIIYGKNNHDKIEAGLNDLEDALKVVELQSKKDKSVLKDTGGNKNNLVLHQYVAIEKESKILFGTIIELNNENIEVEVMANANLDMPNLFIYPPDDASVTVKHTDVLPLLPVFSLNVNFSARTNPVWELENLEAFKSFA